MSLFFNQHSISQQYLKKYIFIKYIRGQFLITHSSPTSWQSLYHLCQNLSKVSVSRLLETFSTYITVWGALGMQPPHCLNCRERRAVQQCGKHKYRQRHWRSADQSTYVQPLVLFLGVKLYNIMPFSYFKCAGQAWFLMGKLSRKSSAALMLYSCWQILPPEDLSPNILFHKIARTQ